MTTLAADSVGGITLVDGLIILIIVVAISVVVGMVKH